MPESNVGAGGVYVVPGSTQTEYSQWLGWYYATVSNNADPLAIGRCQLRIPQVLGTEVSTWAWALTTNASTAATAAASTTPPPVGTVVAVTFLGGDLSNPAYLLVTTSATTVTTPVTTGGTSTTGGGPGTTPSISTTSLPNGSASTAYNQTVAVSGGTSPYTYTVTSGALPSWATLNASTGVISGTPTANGTATFTITVTDASGGTSTQVLTLTVGSYVIDVLTRVLPTAQTGQAFSVTLASLGGVAPYTWSVTAGSLPAGLTLTASTGVIAGTATTAGTGSATVQVTDSGGNTATQALATTVITGPDGGPAGSWTLGFADEFNVAFPTPYGTGPDPNTWADHYISGDLGRNNGTPEQEWFPHGYYGHSVANSIWTSTEKYQNPSTIDATCTSSLAVTAGAATGLSFTSAMISGHLSQSAFTYGYIEARVQQPTPSSAWSAFWMLTRGYLWPPEIDIAEWQPPGYSGQNQLGYYNDAGTWQSYYQGGDSGSTWDVWGCEISSGSVTYYKNGSEVTSHTYDGHAFPWYPIINMGVQGSTGSGYPATYNVDYVRVWVPAGVPASPVITGISPSNGVPSGGSVIVTFDTVSGATSYRVTASPTDAIQDDIDNYGNDGNGLSSYTATGSTSPLTVSGLPAGGRWNFTVAAINATGYSMESAPVGPQIISIQMVTTVLPAATAGTPYTATLAAQAGNPPYTWAITSGSLPAGLTLAPTTGVISGTPTGSGTSAFTVTVSGATNWTGGTTVANSASASLSISLAGAASGSSSGSSGSTTTGGSTGTAMPIGPTGTWTLAFEDMFPGTSLNTANWAANVDGSTNSATNTTLVAGNVSVSGGNLILQLSSPTAGALVASSSVGGYAGGSSGPILAVGDCCECSMMVPGSSGASNYNWPAWWAAGASWPSNGEEDIMEGNGSAMHALNYHAPSGSFNGPVPSGSWVNAFHSYTLVRGETTLDVYWDGKLVNSGTRTDAGGGQALIFAMGNSGNIVTGAAGAIHVAYVRMWTPG